MKFLNFLVALSFFIMPGISVKSYGETQKMEFKAGDTIEVNYRYLSGDIPLNERKQKFTNKTIIQPARISSGNACVNGKQLIEAIMKGSIKGQIFKVQALSVKPKEVDPSLQTHGAIEVINSATEWYNIYLVKQDIYRIFLDVSCTEFVLKNISEVIVKYNILKIKEKDFFSYKAPAGFKYTSKIFCTVSPLNNEEGLICGKNLIVFADKVKEMTGSLLGICVRKLNAPNRELGMVDAFNSDSSAYNGFMNMEDGKPVLYMDIIIQ